MFDNIPWNEGYLDVRIDAIDDSVDLMAFFAFYRYLTAVSSLFSIVLFSENLRKPTCSTES